MELDLKITPAADARRIVDSGQYDLAMRQLRDVTTQIDEAISQGQLSVSGNGHLQPAVIEKLQQAGYTAKNNSWRNESTWSVTW